MATLAKLGLLLIALLIGAFISVGWRREDGENSFYLKPFGTIISALLVLLSLALMPAFGYIQVGHRGVVVGPNGIVLQHVNGVEQGWVLGEGFYFVPPFLYNVEVMSVRTEAFKTDAEAASSDLQDVKATIVVNYRLEPENVWRVYQQLGVNYLEKVFSPAVQEALKASTALFDAEDLIQKRAFVSKEIRKVLEERGERFGFEVQAVSIVNFNFSDEFNVAIEKKARATQDAETARRVKEKVKAEQEAKVYEYQAEATKRRLELEAQAAGQRAQLQYITPQLIQLRRVDADLKRAEAALVFANSIKDWRPQWITGENLNMFLSVAPPSEGTTSQGK